MGTGKLINGILGAAKEAGHAVCGGHINGMFGFFFTEGPVTCFADATKSDTEKFARWHRMMLERGVYLAPSQYEAGFTSLAHTEEDVDRPSRQPRRSSPSSEFFLAARSESFIKAF